MGLGKTGYYPHSCVIGGMADYQFRVGSLIMPPKPPSTMPEMFCELMKAVGSMSDLNHAPSIEKVSYSLPLSLQYTAETAASLGVSTIGSGSAYFGLDLENYAGSDRSQIFSGYNSNTDDIYFVGNINITTTANSAAYNPRFDAFAMFDSCLVFENATAYVVF